MLIDSISGPGALFKNSIVRTRYERAEEMAEAHKWFYEQAQAKSLYHPDTRFSFEQREVEGNEAFVFLADMLDLERLILPDHERLADDLRQEAINFLDIICGYEDDPGTFTNHPALEDYGNAMGLDRAKNQVYLTTLCLVLHKSPSLSILSRYKEQKGIDLIPSFKKGIQL